MLLSRLLDSYAAVSYRKRFGRPCLSVNNPSIVVTTNKGSTYVMQIIVNNGEA